MPPRQIPKETLKLNSPRGGRYPQASTDTNVTVIVTNVGADYTSLGSFGTPESFGANLVSQMDRSFLLRSGFNRPKRVQVGPLWRLLARLTANPL